MRKGARFIFLFAIFFLVFIVPFVNAIEVIQQVQEPQQQQPKGMWAGLWSFFTSPLLWGFIILLLMIGVVGVLIVWLVRVVVRHIKLQNDAIYRIRVERVKLALAQKRLPVRHAFWKFWSYPTDYPIRLARKDDKGRLRLSSPIAYYRGDFQSHEGNLYIVFNMSGNHHLWGLIPQVELIVIPNKKDKKVLSLEKDDIKDVEIKNIPLADDIVQFNENEVLLYAEGLSNAGYFYYPALKSKDGKIIDLSVPIYESIKEVALNNIMYVQTDLFAQVSKKIIDLNPYARYSNKVNDNNQSVEVPTGSGQGSGG
jgi:hypothetical protein